MHGSSARNPAPRTHRRPVNLWRSAALLICLSASTSPTFTAPWNVQAQIVGPVITGPGAAELNRVTTLLNNARTLDQQLAALGEAQPVLNAVAQLPASSLAPKTKVALKAYVNVAMKVLQAMTLVCESRQSKKISLQARGLLSALVRDVNSWLDQSAVKRLKARLEKCLGPVNEYQGTVDYTFKTAESLIRSRVTVTWLLQNSAQQGDQLDILTYTAVGSVKVDASENACRGSGTFTLTDGVLTVTRIPVKLSGLPVGELYGFSLASSDLLMLTCPNSPPRPVPAAVLASDDLTPLKDLDMLKGSSSRDGASTSWSFQAVDYDYPGKP